MHRRTNSQAPWLALAQADHDEHHTRGKGSTARPRRDLVALLQLGFDLTDLEKALVAGIRWRFDENVEAAGNQDRTDNLNCAHRASCDGLKIKGRGIRTRL